MKQGRKGHVIHAVLVWMTQYDQMKYEQMEFLRMNGQFICNNRRKGRERI